MIGWLLAGGLWLARTQAFTSKFAALD